MEIVKFNRRIGNVNAKVGLFTSGRDKIVEVIGGVVDCSACLDYLTNEVS